jgi:tocopherol cyclase
LLTKLPPHAGYHGGLATRQVGPFFEGWYLRIVTKEGTSFAFIYHIFDPHLLDSRRRGVGLQAITPERTVAVESSDLYRFRADSNELYIRNLFRGGDSFELTKDKAFGRASDADCIVSFAFDLKPIVGWGGGAKSRQYSTAGWLAAFPFFEPHYQVLISKGFASGSVLVQNRDDGEVAEHKFTDASLYLEKNWGGSFPSAWWWIQANTFKSDISVTSTGGRRKLPLLQNQEEDVAFVGLHWDGLFLPFSTCSWDIQWGEWRIHGSYEEYIIQLTGTCEDDGLPIRCPSPTGMQENALETFRGKLRVELSQAGAPVLDETTTFACLEIGGIPWLKNRWSGESMMVEPLKSIVMNRELDRLGANALSFVNKFVDIPGL